MGKHRKLLAALLAAVLLAGCSLPDLEWLPRVPEAALPETTPAPETAAEPLTVLLGEGVDSENGFAALLAAYTASQGAGVRLLRSGDADAGQAGLVLLARRPEPSQTLDLAGEPLLGLLAQSAAALPGPDAQNAQNTQNGCAALPLGFSGCGYLADGALLKALLGDGFDPALLAGASWAEWEDFIKTLGGWIDSPADQKVTLSGREFALPAEKPDAAQNLTGVFALPAAEPETFAGSSLSPALCAAFADAEAVRADPELLTGPLNGVWAALRLEQEWAAGPGPDGSDDPDGPDAKSAAALLESGQAVFCRAGTGGLTGCSAEFRARLLLLPFKTALDETDLAPDAVFSLEALNGWPVVGTPGWLAIPAGAFPEQQALAEGFLLWLFASAEGQAALEDTMGALSIAGTSEPQSPALRTVADALHSGQALPDLAAGFAPQTHARASEAFAETAGASGSAVRAAWVAAVLETLAGG